MQTVDYYYSYHEQIFFKTDQKSSVKERQKKCYIASDHLIYKTKLDVYKLHISVQIIQSKPNKWNQCSRKSLFPALQTFTFSLFQIFTFIRFPFPCLHVVCDLHYIEDTQLASASHINLFSCRRCTWLMNGWDNTNKCFHCYWRTCCLIERAHVKLF